MTYIPKNVHVKVNDFFERISYRFTTLLDGENNIVGDASTISSTQTINSSSGVTVTEINNHHLALYVTSMTSPGTIRIIGDSFDSDTGLVAGDHEDITITETGYYKTNKYWSTGNIVVGNNVQTTANVIADVLDFDSYHISYRDGAIGYIDMVKFHYSTSSANNEVRIIADMYRFGSHQKVNIIDETISNIGNNKHYGYKRTNLDIPYNFDNGDRLIVKLVTNNAQNCSFDCLMRFQTP